MLKKVFTHGSTYNFQESAREMFLCDLEELLHHYQEEKKQIVFGTIHLDKEEIHQFGYLERAVFGEEVCEFLFNRMDGEKQKIEHLTQMLVMSHDAVFNVFDESDQEVVYQVIYWSFQTSEDEEETTYFLAKEGIVAEPLACVAEFWQHTCEIGRDVDFSLTGCRTKAFCM